MKKIALTYNGKNHKSYQVLLRLADYLKSRGAEVADNRGRPGFALDEIAERDFSFFDAVIALGGDGTMLASTRAVAASGVPLFGVNLGQVGFLSSAEEDGMFQAADRLLAGDYQLRERLMIRCCLRRGGATAAECIAFNDFVVSSNFYARAVNVDLYIAGQHIHTYSLDGLIVATPTGATGYSLSAGGPILMEDLEVLLVTPVCPHSFFSRPIVSKASDTVEVVYNSAADVALLTADGQYRFSLIPEDRIVISAADFRARIISFGQKNFFDHIKNKLYF